MLHKMLKILATRPVLVVAKEALIQRNFYLAAAVYGKSPEFIIKESPNEDQKNSLEEESKKVVSPRIAEFRKKLREKSPIDDLGEQPMSHPSQEQDPLPAWPDGRNPHTGEVGGPRGPEPTRYGDWERKGRVSDF